MLNAQSLQYKNVKRLNPCYYTAKVWKALEIFYFATPILFCSLASWLFCWCQKLSSCIYNATDYLDYLGITEYAQNPWRVFVWGVGLLRCTRSVSSSSGWLGCEEIVGRGHQCHAKILTFSMRQSMRPNTRSSGTFMTVRVEKGSSTSSSGVLIAWSCWCSHCLGSGGVTVSLWSLLCVHNSPGEQLGFPPEARGSLLFSKYATLIPHILSHSSSQAMLLHNCPYWWF